MRNPFNPLWKQISIDFDKKTFNLKLGSKKELFIVNGKFAMHEPCVNGFSINGDILAYKSILSKPNLIAIIEKFERILKGNE